MLIDKNGETHQHALPWGYRFSQLILPPEHEDKVGNEYNQEGDEGDEVGRYPFRRELQQELSKGRPKVFIGETGRAALVFEVLEVDLFYVIEDGYCLGGYNVALMAISFYRMQLVLWAIYRLVYGK